MIAMRFSGITVGLTRAFGVLTMRFTSARAVTDMGPTSVRMLDLGWDAGVEGSTASSLAAGELTLLHPRAARWLHLRHHHHTLTASQRRVGLASVGDARDAAPLRSRFSEPGRDLSVDLGW